MARDLLYSNNHNVFKGVTRSRSNGHISSRLCNLLLKFLENRDDIIAIGLLCPENRILDNFLWVLKAHDVHHK